MSYGLESWTRTSRDMGVSDNAVPVEVRAVDDRAAHRELYRFRVTARSYLGAVVLHTGGLLIDSG